MSASRPDSIALIACRVLEAELDALLRDAPHVVHRQFFEIGLHDQPEVLRTRLAAAIGRAESMPGVDAVVLAYGLCGLALVGLAPRRRPLIVPRAHDCLTLFLGSKERYAACMRAEPATYWYSPGWNRGGCAPGPDRAARLRRQYTARFGPDEAEGLLEMERACFAHFTTAAYTDLGRPGDDVHRRYAERCAKALGWRFQTHAGDDRLLRALLHGPWEGDRFLIVRPGERIVHSADSRIIAAAAVPP